MADAKTTKRTRKAAAPKTETPATDTAAPVETQAPAASTEGLGELAAREAASTDAAKDDSDLTVAELNQALTDAVGRIETLTARVDHLAEQNHKFANILQGLMIDGRPSADGGHERPQFARAHAHGQRIDGQRIEELTPVVGATPL